MQHTRAQSVSPQSIAPSQSSSLPFRQSSASHIRQIGWNSQSGSEHPERKSQSSSTESVQISGLPGKRRGSPSSQSSPPHAASGCPSASASTGALMQPTSGSQKSALHASPSSQSAGGTRTHRRASHRPPPSQNVGGPPQSSSPVHSPPASRPASRVPVSRAPPSSASGGSATSNVDRPHPAA